MSAGLIIGVEGGIMFLLFWIGIRGLIKEGTVKTATPNLFFLSNKYREVKE